MAELAWVAVGPRESLVGRLVGTKDRKNIKVSGVHAGNLVLVGNVAPFKINGEVLIMGDVVIRVDSVSILVLSVRDLRLTSKQQMRHSCMPKIL